MRRMGLGLVWVAMSGCALGIGGIAGGNDALLVDRTADQHVVGGGKDYVLVTRRDAQPRLPMSVTAGGGAALGVVLSEAAAGPGYVLTARAEVAFSPSARRHTRGAHVPTLALQYQYSVAHFLAVPGELPNEAQSLQHGLVGYVGWSFGHVILEGGAGALFAGTLVPNRSGVRGWVDPVAPPAGDPSAGVRGAARVTLMVRQGNVPGHLGVRAELGAQRVWSTLNPARTFSTLTMSIELVASFF